jgi:uncharacterized repeat protein (TIGR02059 family)
MSKISFYWKFLFLVVFLTCSSISFATNYYVSGSGGNDSGDGKSELTAWKTIAKINGKTFLPGDSILFKRGDVWRETLTIPSSGSSAGYIGFAAYGTGNKPRILGSTQAINWTPEGHTNIWVSATTLNNPASLGMTGSDIFFDNSGTITQGLYKAYSSTFTNLASEYNWTWNGNKIYIYAASDPDSRYTSVEVPQLAWSISINEREYISIDGFELQFACSGGITTASYPTANKSHLTIKNCNINYSGLITPGVNNDKDNYGIHACYSYMLIQNNVIHDMGRRPISIYNYGSGFTVTNVVVDGNTLYNGYHTTGIDISCGNSPNTADFDGIIIRNNLIYDNANAYCYGSELINVESYYTAGVNIHNVQIYNNILKNPQNSGVHIYGIHGVKIFNNTFYGHNENAAGNTAHIKIQNECTGVEIKNNIFYSPLNVDGSSSGNAIYTGTTQTTASITADYNLYYRINSGYRILEIRDGASLFHYNDIALIRSSLGWETHGQTIDPKFTSATDFHLLVTSTGLGAGIAVPEVVTDFSGNSYSNPPNIGCYATPVLSSSLTYISSLVANATPSILEMTYNKALANIVPAASSFAVLVNSVSRTVNAVTISGSTVQLTLSGPVAYGDIITVAYNKPGTNPLQTSTGEQAASLTAQNVTNNLNAPSPVYVSSAVQNATATLIELTYDLSLANIIPASTAFSVTVNSVSRTVNSVTISGTIVRLTLASPVVYGDAVTVAYTKPAVNPLQTSAGGQAATFTSKPVTNNVNPAIPVYVSSVIQNATPTLLEMTYNITLANIVPAPSAFTVTVNSVSRAVNTVTVSGTIVRLTLASEVVSGNVITVAYTKPALNPLQASSGGGQAATLSAVPVTNNVSSAIPVYVSSVIDNAAPTFLVMTYSITLANIIPAASSFTVNVNSAPRTVNSVVITGNKVQLTLTSAVNYGDIVTVAYSKPASNPLQSTTSGQAASLPVTSVTNNVSATSPVFVSSVIENATPNVLEMTYHLTLANIVPAAAAFTVTVNSGTRSINSVSINGTRVLLTLASAVAYGDAVTVAYTKPSVNPLQTPSGGYAATLNATTVSNNVSPAVPLYISSTVQNATPSLLSISFTETLDNISPPANAFTVLVNSTPRTVNSVSVIGNIVTLTLGTAIINGDIVTVAYSYPGSNPLQTPLGGKVASFTAKTVTNNVGVANTPPVIAVVFSDTCTSGFIGEIDASGSTDINNDFLSYSWTSSDGTDISSSTGSKIKFLAPIVSVSTTLNFTLNVSDGKSNVSENILISVLPYKPELQESIIPNVESSGYLGSDIPENISDGNINTYWSADGDNQWLTGKFKNPFRIDHFKLSFSKENTGGSFFDILASKDSLVWDQLLTNATSSGFSNNLQVFKSDGSSLNAYSFVKFVGHGNSLNTLNKVSELQVFGGIAETGGTLNVEMTVFPNPAREIINIFFKQSLVKPQIIRVVNTTGKIEYEASFAEGTSNLQIPVTFSAGFYVIQSISAGRINGATKVIVQ